MPSTEKQTFHLGCPLLGAKRKSISGDWMSAFSHKRKFGVSSEAAIFDPVIELIFPAMLPPNPFKLHLARETCEEVSS